MKFLSISLKEIDSTQTLARHLIEKGKACNYDFIAIISEKQTGGRGQKDNKWSSEKGGLYLSIIKKTDEKKLKNIQELSIKSAKIILDEISKRYSLELKIKEPNDIYALTKNGYKKICGILIETIPYRNERYVIIGIGINFYNPLPDELKEKATSLYEIKAKKYRVKNFAKKLIDIFSKIDI